MLQWETHFRPKDKQQAEREVMKKDTPCTKEIKIKTGYQYLYQKNGLQNRHC